MGCRGGDAVGFPPTLNLTGRRSIAAPQGTRPCEACTKAGKGTARPDQRGVVAWPESGAHPILGNVPAMCAWDGDVFLREMMKDEVHTTK